MLSRLADLEELVNQVPDPSIKAYSEEALACYQAGAYRSSIVSLWIAIVFDLFQKIAFIAQQHNDPAAKICLAQIEKLRADPDKKQAGKWEAELLEHAYERVKLLTSQEYNHLKRIQQDRHLCAHPALDRDEKLFQPSAELARIHLRTALETLLCQPALIGKATVEAIQREVNSAYFPTNPESIEIVVDKLIPKASDNHIHNLFKFLLKYLLFSPTDTSNPKATEIETKYLLVFKTLFNKFHSNFLKIERQTITSIIDGTNEKQYRVLSRLLAYIPDLHPYLSALVIEKLKVALKKHNQEIVLITLPVFSSEDRFETYKALGTRQKDALEAINNAGVAELDASLKQMIINHNIESFAQSGSFAGGRYNAETLIIPILQWFSSDDIKTLLSLIIQEQQGGYNQLIDTTEVMVELFTISIKKYPQLLEDWIAFIEAEQSRWRSLYVDISTQIQQLQAS